MSIDLDFPLQLYDTDLIQIKSLHIPNTLKTTNSGLNASLWCELDNTNDLSGDWTQDGHGTRAVVRGEDNEHYSYDKGNGQIRYMYIQDWDLRANPPTATMIWSHDLEGTDSSATLTWNGTDFRNGSGTLILIPPNGTFDFAASSSDATISSIDLTEASYDITTMGNFAQDLQNKLDSVWTDGTNGLVSVSGSNGSSVVTIAPVEANANFHIYSDRELKKKFIEEMGVYDAIFYCK